MTDILVMGEMLVEIMRDRENVPLYEAGVFKGPYPSGAPAICIDAAARLGCRTAIIGGVGRDDFGKCLLERLKKDGVDVSHVIESEERSTGCAFVTYFEDGSRKFIFHMGNTPAVEAKAPQPEDFQGVKYMHIMGCSLMADKGFAQEILKTMRLLSKTGTKISFDPNIRKELFTDDSIQEVIGEVMKHTSIFLPGVEELLSITGKTDIGHAVRQCFENPALEILVLKNGSKGSRIYTRDEVKEVGIYPVKQLDATGAGDCYDGAFLAGLVQGKSVEEAAQMGAAAGALNAAAFGPMEGRISLETVQRMMKNGIATKQHLFLTSSPCSNEVPEGVDLPCILNEANGFVERLSEYWKPESRGLIISAFPDHYEMNDEMADTFFRACSYHGLTLSEMLVCDDRNADKIEELMKNSDMIILAGGHVPTQNAFFHRIGLRELIQDYKGIVMGISAGTMNCADTVYAQPEEEGESVDPDYQRWLPGLGLTELMILPHYQEVKDNILDGRRLYEEITYPDSMGNEFYVLVDGSYVLVEDDRTDLYGEAYLIKDGQIEQICEEGESI